MSSKYSWPSSRLTAKEMAMLHHVRTCLGVPITELLRAAVEILYAQKIKKGDLTDEQNPFGSSVPNAPGRTRSGRKGTEIEMAASVRKNH